MGEALYPHEWAIEIIKNAKKNGLLFATSVVGCASLFIFLIFVGLGFCTKDIFWFSNTLTFGDAVIIFELLVMCLVVYSFEEVKCQI